METLCIISYSGKFLFCRLLRRNILNIRIDTSKVSGIIDGTSLLEKNIIDTWRYKNLEFHSGKIYGIVSEYGQGCMYLSYLLGGNVDFGELQVFADDEPITESYLQGLSWNLEPSYGKYKNKRVKKSIENAIKEYNCKNSFDEIANTFMLTESRYDRKLQHLSGERWRASAALGYAYEKKIFYAPYKTSNFYHQMNNSNLFKVLRFLADNGAIVVLPVGSDAFIKNVVDECIYLDPEYM